MRWRLAAVTLSAGMCLLSTPPAHAQVDHLSLSLDGQHWSSSIERPLFEPSRRWVPGDKVSVPFFVRNDSGEAADLVVDVIDVDGTLRIGRELTLSAEYDGRTVALRGNRLLSAALPDTDPKQIRLTVAFPASSGNETQRSSGSFRIRVTLTQDVQPPPPSSPPPIPTASPSNASGSPTGGPSNGLPDTGAPPWTGVGALAGVSLICAGVALGIRRRWSR